MQTGMLFTVSTLAPTQPYSYTVPSALEIGQEALVQAFNGVRKQRVSTTCPDWGLLRVLAQNVVVSHAGAELHITVGQGRARTTLTAKPDVLTTGLFEDLRCSICRRGTCIHRWAFGVAWLLNSSAGRDLLDEAHCADLVTEETVGAPWPKTPDPTTTSPLRFLLRSQAPGDLSFVEVMMLPRSSRTGRLLGMRSAPTKVDSIIKKVGALPRSDWEAVRRIEQLRLLEHMASHHYAHSTQLRREIATLRWELAVCLAGVTHLEYDGRRVQGNSTPWDGETERYFDPQHGLCVHWKSAMQLELRVGTWFVVDAEGQFRPVTAKARQMMGFLGAAGARFVPNHDLPVVLSSPIGRCFPNRPALDAQLQPKQGTPIPEAYHTEQGKNRRLILRYAYGTTKVAWNDPPYCVELRDAGPPIIHHRNTNAEVDFEVEFLNAHHPKLFTVPKYRIENTTGAALDPQSPLGQVMPPSGELHAVVPKLSVSASEGGVVLDLSFQSDSYPVPPQRIVDAWNTGQKSLLRLDGRPAALPESWLSTFGETLEDLVLLTERYGTKLPLTALPLIPASVVVSDTSEAGLDVAGYQSLNDHQQGQVPKGFIGELREYQNVGFQWLRTLYRLNLGGLLADDMGLGKTIQTIALLSYVHLEQGRGRSLIVAPTSVLINWREEVERFAPDLDVTLFYGKERAIPDQGLVLTTYAMLRRHARQLAKPDWEVMVLDEAQSIKNPTSQTARAARRLKGTMRLALTGTPFENDLEELWSVMEFVLPGFFGRLTRFKKDFSAATNRPNSAKGSRQISHLKRRIGPFVLRRLKDDVVQELPGRQIQIVSCELGSAQRAIYSDIESRYRRSVAFRIAQVGFTKAKFMILEALTRLRQAACDPVLLPGVEQAESAKRERLRTILQDSTANGRRVLVFSQWPSLLRRVVGDLEALGLDFLYLDGQTTERAALQSDWNSDAGPPVFLISLKAGGSGLNLIGADTVVHLDPWWNPAVEAQAMDRCYRIGQTRSVIVYKLIAHGTVEDRVVRTQSRKQALFDAFFSDEPREIAKLDLSDLQLLFGESRDGEPPLPAPSSSTSSARHIEEDRLPMEIHELLNIHGKLTNQSVRAVLGCSADVARRRLKEWAKRGLLIRRGRRQNTRYIPG